jgi:hypothetical protein
MEKIIYYFKLFNILFQNRNSIFFLKNNFINIIRLQFLTMNNLITILKFQNIHKCINTNLKGHLLSQK